jgi:hypothetical protein
MAIVVAVSRELRLQALDRMSQRFWHGGQIQCTTPTNAPIYSVEDKVENKQRKSRLRTKAAKMRPRIIKRELRPVVRLVNKALPSTSQASTRSRVPEADEGCLAIAVF